MIKYEFHEENQEREGLIKELVWLSIAITIIISIIVYGYLEDDSYYRENGFQYTNGIWHKPAELK
jgi:hypothetical protein